MRAITRLLSFFLFLGQFAAFAQDESKTQKGYHLFNPTPRENMREFSIDRPDVTESPITVDAGHFQLEADVVKWTGENQGNDDRTINIWSALYKMGLSSSWDIHIGAELYNIRQTPEGDTYDKGYGNTTIRLKHNFWGNDGGKTAFGIIPYVTFTSDNETVYGAGFPFSVGLTEKLDLGAQAQLDFIPVGDDRKMSYFQTVVLGGELIGPMDFYVEGLATFFESESYLSANGGLIYNASDNLKIDVATNLGLNEGTPTRVYLGLSFRI